jgi:hypothetical protein
MPVICLWFLLAMWVKMVGGILKKITAGMPGG